MNYSLTIIFNFSIVIASIIGLARFGKIYRSYQPFIYITTLGFFSELISTISVTLYHTNAVVYNIFSLIECILWFWLFRRWKALNTLWKSILLPATLILIWVIQNIVMSKLTTFSSLFSIAYSFSLVFLAINQVNQLIVQEKKNLLLNAKFLILCGIIIFYTYRILGESFYLFELDKVNSLLANITYMVVFVNLFVNLLYAYATLWIPTRERFTLPS
jgi:hypothetical protein